MKATILSKVKIQNFRSILDLELSFPRGLIVFCGPNGSGKSSVIYAIQYALFGRVRRLSKQTLQSNLTDDECKVALEFSNGLVVSRGKRLVLRKGGKALSVRERETATELFGNLSLAFLGVDTMYFVDALPSERRKILAPIIPDLKVLLDVIAPKVKACVQHLFDYRAIKEKKQAELEGQLKVVEDMYKELSYDYSQAKELISKKSKELEMLESAIARLTKEKEQFESAYDLKSVKAHLQALQAKRDLLSRQIQAISSLDQRIQSHQNLLQALQEQVSKCDREIQKITKSVSKKVCEWCGSKLQLDNVQILSSKLEQKRKEKEGLLQKIESIQQELAKLLKERQDPAPLEVELKEVNEEIEKINADLDAYRAVLGELSRLQQERDVLKSSLQKAYGVLERKEELQKLGYQRKRLQEQVKHTSRVVTRVDKIWRLFQDLELLIKRDLFEAYVAQACQYIEHCANELLASEGLAVSIMPKQGAIELLVNGRSLFQHSAGERQRVRLAVSVAFSALARSSPFIFLDEVLDAHLDENGIEFVTTVVIPWLVRHFEQVVVVSHKHELLYALQPDAVFQFQKVNGITEVVSG